MLQENNFNFCNPERYLIPTLCPSWAHFFFLHFLCRHPGRRPLLLLPCTKCSFLFEPNAQKHIYPAGFLCILSERSFEKFHYLGGDFEWVCTDFARIKRSVNLSICNRHLSIDFSKICAKFGPPSAPCVVFATKMHYF